MSERAGNPPHLSGQIAMVTGGSGGIGRAIARALAAAGAKVAVMARSPGNLAETVALIKEAGGHAIAIAADVTDPAVVEQAVKNSALSM